MSDPSQRPPGQQPPWQQQRPPYRGRNGGGRGAAWGRQQHQPHQEPLRWQPRDDRYGHRSRHYSHGHGRDDNRARSHSSHDHGPPRDGRPNKRGPARHEYPLQDPRRPKLENSDGRGDWRRGDPTPFSSEPAAAVPIKMEIDEGEPAKKEEKPAAINSEEKWEKDLLACYKFTPSKGTLPAEAFVPDSEEWLEKKKEAAAHATQVVKKALQDDWEDETDDDEGSRSDDSYGRPISGNGSLSWVDKFCNALVGCTPLTIGFDVFGLQTNDDTNCHCPCSRNLSGWWERFGLTGSLKEKDCGKGKFAPIGLMAHLREEGNRCNYHYCVKEYLEKLYCKNEGSHYRVPIRIGHKAMYMVGDAQYKKAEAAEKRSLLEELWAGRRHLEAEKARRMELETEREEQKTQLEILKQTNKDHYKRIQELEKDRQDLHVEKKEAPLEMSSGKMEHYKKSIASYFDNTKKIITKFEKGEEALVLKVPQSFSLQHFFDKWFESKKDKRTASILFHDLNGKKDGASVLKILSKWDVCFDNEARSGGNDDAAIDEGGPTREFLSQCWRQMSALRVCADVRLFEDHTNGAHPLTDEKLRKQLEVAMKTQYGEIDMSELDGFMTRAKAHYRALGRIMLHSLANGHTIAASATPPLHLNWLLRGCSPKDDDYHRDDILKHISDSSDKEKPLRMWIGVEHEFNDGTTEVLNSDNMFTKLLPEQFLHARDQTLGAIREGLTLDGIWSLALPDFLRPFPLEAVQKIAFSRPELSADGVISILSPDYISDWEGDAAEGENFFRTQKEFFTNVLCGVIKERGEGDPQFLAMFVKHCTGFDYLPYKDADPDFKIKVEFSFVQPQEGGYPMAHTCDKTLKLPGRLCPKGRDEFEGRLDYAVKVYGDRLDMM